MTCHRFRADKAQFARQGVEADQQAIVRPDVNGGMEAVLDVEGQRANASRKAGCGKTAGLV